MRGARTAESGRDYKYRSPQTHRCMTVKEIVELDDELDAEFRKAIMDAKGLKKGVIKESFEEAVKAWIKEQKRLRKEAKSIG